MKRRYEDLLAWQKGHRLVIACYKATQAYPTSEQYGIVSQIRRAAVSITANIVEGQSRAGRNEFKHFLSISRGSAAELDYLLLLSRDLGYLAPEASDELCQLCDDVIRLLTRLMLSSSASAP